MLRDRLDQRVSKVKALLQLCKGALPRENQTGGKQKKAVPMPRVRTLRKQETRIPHTGSEHLNSALNIRATGSVAKLARLHSVGMRLGCPPPLRRKKIGNQLILPRVMAKSLLDVILIGILIANNTLYTSFCVSILTQYNIHI